MSRVSYAVVSVLLAVLITSAAMPASADINLLENPGFETGDFPPWNIGGWGGGGDVWEDGHTGSYYAHLYEVEEGGVFLYQLIDPPRCAEYLEFWYRGYGGVVKVYYSDDTHYEEGLSGSEQWALVPVDLDTTKLVSAVETTAYYTLDLDDFDLEACSVAVGGEVLTPTPILSPVMLIAVIAAASVAIVLGYRFTRR